MHAHVGRSLEWGRSKYGGGRVGQRFPIFSFYSDICRVGGGEEDSLCQTASAPRNWEQSNADKSVLRVLLVVLGVVTCWFHCSRVEKIFARSTG